MIAKKMVFGLFPFLLLLLSITSVNAQEDFTAFSSDSIELCPCSNQAYTVTVQNTGSVASSYSVVAEGDVAGWVTFQPQKFSMDPGQRGNFFVSVNSVCNVKGNFDLDIFITTSDGLTKLVEQDIQINECYDYSLEQGEVVDEVDESVDYIQHDGSYSLCTDEQSSIPLLMTNEENFENGYRLFLDAPEWAELNVRDVRLDAGASGIFLIDIDTADVNGNFNFKLSSISELGKVQRNSNIEVSVGECYVLDVQLEKEEDVVCGGESKSYEVNVKNLGIIPQSIKLDVDGPTWAGFGNSSDSLSIDPEEVKRTLLTINPPEEASGNFLITVDAVFEDETKPSFSDTLNINAVDTVTCYRADIKTKSQVTNLYEEDFFSIKVTNDGIKKTDYEVSLDGPSWVSVNPEFLRLKPGQTGNLNLHLNPSEDIEANTYSINIILDRNGVIYSKNVDVVLRKESELEGKVKSTIKSIQYYLYLVIAIIILILIFIKPIIRMKSKLKKKREKYKVRRERLLAAKIVKEQREEEKAKQREREEELKEKERRKSEEREKKERKKKFKSSWKKHKTWVYSLIVLAVLVFLGQNFKLYNLKYTHIYLRNIFYGYLYYILIGIGTVIALFVLILIYNRLIRKKKKGKKDQTEKKSKKTDKWYNKTSYVLAIFVPILILISALAYFNLYATIKDFVILYSYYFGLGFILLIVLIVLLKFQKPILKFLRE